MPHRLQGELIIHSCDVGSPASVLSGKFPELPFDGFAELIGAMPEEQSVAIIGHSNGFKGLAGFEMHNCEVKKGGGQRPIPSDFHFNTQEIKT